MFARVAEQDARAVALLSAYRGRLVGAMRDRDVYFEMTRELAGEEARLLTKSEYLAEPLTLKYL